MLILPMQWPATRRRVSGTLRGIKVSARHRSTGEGRLRWVSIEVQDQGFGMNAEQPGRVCERFDRVDAPGQIPGTGLGMRIVKRSSNCMAARSNSPAHQASAPRCGSGCPWPEALSAGWTEVPGTTGCGCP